ncbi:MAG: D-2-hydroxyacid dehydrogenase, partial [Ruminococcus sp.]|nr:D-2-hydroxyacid dehydrogenase [Ruminococcus sp.]
MHIVILDWKTMTMNYDLDYKCFEDFGCVSCYDFTPNELAAQRIGDADIVLCNKVRITSDVMTLCPNL